LEYAVDHLDELRAVVAPEIEAGGDHPGGLDAGVHGHDDAVRRREAAAYRVQRVDARTHVRAGVRRIEVLGDHIGLVERLDLRGANVETPPVPTVRTTLT